MTQWTRRHSTVRVWSVLWLCALCLSSRTPPVSPSWPGSLFPCRRRSTPSWRFAKETQSTSFWYKIFKTLQYFYIKCLNIWLHTIIVVYTFIIVRSGEIIDIIEILLWYCVAFVFLVFCIFDNVAWKHPQVKKEENGTIHVIKQRQLHLSCDIISLSVSNTVLLFKVKYFFCGLLLYYYTSMWWLWFDKH